MASPRIALLLALVSLASWGRSPRETACHYLDVNHPRDEMIMVKSCTHVSGGKTVMDAVHLKKLSYANHGMAGVLVGDQYYWVKPSGAMLPVPSPEGVPDFYSEGLVRSWVGKKVAYYDLNFKQVIPPTYDWGWPFENGRAAVCLGCTLSGKDDWGYPTVEGGKWGFIDRTGREVVPVKLTRDQMP